MARSRTWSISADWLVPGDGPPIRGGVLRGRGKVIEAVGPPEAVTAAPVHRDLGAAAILPGLVNAHCHLELTHLRGQLPQRRPMTQWLFALMSRRVQGQDVANSVTQGAAECLASGTTAVADVYRNAETVRALRASGLRAMCQAEVTGIGPRADGAMGRLKKRLSGVRKTDHIRPAVCPHAPYSTAENVYRKAIELAHKRKLMVATHLAETEAERQFTLRGSGKFLEFLGHLGLIDSSVTVHGCSPMALAERVGLFEGPSMLAHVNFIDDDEMAILRGSGSSVVYCPRCSDFFGRSGHRYAEMLAEGINVCLGTDSLASNWSLSLLGEMRRVRMDGRVDSMTIFRMATLSAAKAMGWDDQIGSLTAGKLADWTVVEISPEATHPIEHIFTSNARVLETGVGGKVLYTAPHREEAGENPQTP